MVKNNVAGLFGGNHKSKTFGSSCEFAQHREYLRGDDITKIDWNVFARHDKLYLKLFLDERQMHTRIYIDASRSMAFESRKKADQAIKIAAALAYISICEMDKVSIYLVRNKELIDVAVNMVGKDAYYNMIGKLNEIEFDGDSFISDSIVPSNVGYGDGLSFIISDFLTDNDYERAIDHLASKKRDIYCMQVLSDEEIRPNSRGKVHFFDSENVEKFYRKNINREIARAYQRALEYATNRIKDYCQARGGEYQMVSAESSLGEIFFGTLISQEVLK
jgi:hypothetical protein